MRLVPSMRERPKMTAATPGENSSSPTTSSAGLGVIGSLAGRLRQAR
jgi:hypothetical protein